MHKVVQVRIREAGKILLYRTGNVEVNPGDYVIVEAEKGMEYGQIISDADLVIDTEKNEDVKNIVRVATKEDLKQIEKNKKKIKDVLTTCSKRISVHKLDMKLIEGEYSFDRSKIILYFTAEGRVDFRELVKDLARIFKVRIELKQIGVRDEAKLLGGYGPCGRPLCCTQFLRDFEPVTIRMAKEQSLPLNPNKISGGCGRLMCCLQYEYSCYREMLKDMPREGEEVETKEGNLKVVGVNPLKRTVNVAVGEHRVVEIPCDKCKRVHRHHRAKINTGEKEAD